MLKTIINFGIPFAFSISFLSSCGEKAMANNEANVQISTENNVEQINMNCNDITQLEIAINSQKNIFNLYKTLIEAELLMYDCINSQQRADSKNREEFFYVTDTSIPELVRLLEIDAKNWKEEDLKAFENVKPQIKKLLELQKEIMNLFPNLASYEDLTSTFVAGDLEQEHKAIGTDTQSELSSLDSNFENYISANLTKLKADCK